jgi:hypothetical protein
MNNNYVIIILILSGLYSIHLTIKTENQSLITLTLPPEIIIQGTFNGGCGFAYIKKKNSLEGLKKYLTENHKIPIENIKILMLNYKSADNNKKDVPVYIDEKPFRKSEFNIFVINGNTRELVGTSDPNNGNGLHDPYLQYGTSTEKERFHKTVSERILNFYKNNIQ